MDIKGMDNDQLAMLWELSQRAPELKQLIEAELEKRIATNKSVTKEFLFEIVRRKVASVNFIPTSNAFERYGKYVTVLEIVLNDEQKADMLLGIVSVPTKNTFGDITCKILSDEDKEEYATFNTQDILIVKA